MAVHKIPLQEFLIILNEKNVINTVLKKLEFYKVISKVLPGRSVKSCYRFIKRCFNDKNRKGKWSKDEERTLLKYVEEKGEDWSSISKLMGRSSDNIYDKYKLMGNGRERKTHYWLLR